MEGGPPCFGPGFTCPGLLGNRTRVGARLRVRGSHPLRPAFPCRSAGASCSYARPPRAGGGMCGPTTPTRQRLHAVSRAWVWARPLSLAATRGISVDFSSSGYLDVSVPRVVLPRPMRSGMGCRGIAPGGFPHSGTPGSQAVCASPGTIAACRALRRLPAPRHPPCALLIFAPGRMRAPPPRRS